jgi:hypothetical protein
MIAEVSPASSRQQRVSVATANLAEAPPRSPAPVSTEGRSGVCLLLQYLLSSCSRGGRGIVEDRESVLFIGTPFSNLYTAVDTPAMGRVVVCLVFVCLVFVCKYVLGHSRVSQPLNLRLCLLRHLGFLTSPYASPTCRRRRLNSYRLLWRSTPDPPPILWAHLLHLPASPRPPLYTSTMAT